MGIPEQRNGGARAIGMSYQIWGAGFGDPATEGPPGAVAREVAVAGGVAGTGKATGVGGTGLSPGASHEAGGPAYGVTALFRAHHAELVRLAALMTGDRASGEDIALGYVRAAVLNGCRCALRRRAVARRFGGARDAMAGDVTQPSAEHEALLAEDRRQVLAAVARLPRRRREVLVLRYWLGLPEAEIAAVLGISPGTVKSTAARGIAALTRQLGESA